MVNTDRSHGKTMTEIKLVETPKRNTKPIEDERLFHTERKLKLSDTKRDKIDPYYSSYVKLFYKYYKPPQYRADPKPTTRSDAGQEEGHR